MTISEDDVAKGAPVAIGAAAAVCSVVPGIGTAACAAGAAIAAAATALGVALTKEGRDKFKPTKDQAQGLLAWFRAYPRGTMLGVDNSGEPNMAAGLVCYLRFVAGETQLPPGIDLHNPSDKSWVKAYCPIDPSEPLTNPAYLAGVLKDGEKAQPDVKTPAQAQAVLHALRTSIEHSDLLKWSQVGGATAALATEIKGLRKLAGETGEDTALAAALGQSVAADSSAPAPAPAASAPAAKPAAKDPKTAGAGESSEGSPVFGRALLAAVIISGAIAAWALFGAHKSLNTPTKKKR